MLNLRQRSTLLNTPISSTVHSLKTEGETVKAGEGHSEGQRRDEPLWGLADITNGFLKVLSQVWLLHSPSANRLQFLQLLPLDLPELPCGLAYTPGEPV